MANSTTRLSLYAAAFSTCLVASTAMAATIPDTPLQTSTTADPNIMMVLDDSGSMQFEIMPDDYMFFSSGAIYLFPRAGGVYGSTDYSNYVATVNINDVYSRLTRSPQVNPLYYNPGITYKPWVDVNGNSFPAANPQCALHNPRRTTATFDAAYCRNLTADHSNYNSNSWRSCNSAGTCSGTGTLPTNRFRVASYFWYTGGSAGIWTLGNYALRQITVANAPFTGDGRSARTDCTSGSCTYDQEMQNFANWYTYYRSRVLTARAGIGRAFAAQGERMRVGFGAINHDRTTSIDGVSNIDTVITGVRQFSGTNRSNFFNALYDHAIPAMGTPLISALNDVGQYYSGSGTNSAWSTTPGVTGGTELTCRQSYTILMTDGYWSNGDQADTSGARQNVDGNSGAQITGSSTTSTTCGVSTNTQNYTYAPASPFSDSYSGTLADTAMYYWKRDLSSLANQVPSNARDPAFWQHMVTFGVGLGVNGSVDPTTAFNAVTTGATINWGDPTTLNAYKLDDLLHASVNSRGGFFSAQNPDQFAIALGKVLDDIASRSGSAASIAANSTQQTAGTLLFNAKFDTSTWTGELESLPLNNVCASTWRASQQIPSPYTSRTIRTTSGGSFVPFQWTSLSATDQAAVVSSDIVNYIRGDTSREKQNGGTLRNRTKLLGDIVHSSPAYSGDSNTVFVGANDGMLHAFNASTGVELFGYVPSAVIPRLPDLSSPAYSHKFYVDGEIVISERSQTPNKNYLVATLGRGGKGLFGLDVSSPSSFASTGSAWEYFDSTDPDLGYMLGRPIIAKLNNGVMAVIVGNGYNSTDGKAVIYVFNLANGSLIRKFDTLVAGDNGMAAPGVFDSDSDGDIDHIYAGDLKGNVWKIDVSNASPAAWAFSFYQGASPAPLFIAKDASNNLQPITAPMSVSIDNIIGDENYGKRYVFFGTGAFFRSNDLTDTSIQSWYGIIDEGAQITSRSSLTQRSIIFEGVVNSRDVRVTSEATTGDMTNKKGWYMDLVKTNGTGIGERIVTTSKVYRFAEPTLLSSSIIPVVDPCVPGGKGFINAVNPYTGGRLRNAFFDTNNNGTFSDDAYNNMPIGSVGVSGGMPSEILVIGNTINFGTSGGTPGQETANTGARRSGRLSWREIIRD